MRLIFEFEDVRQVSSLLVALTKFPLAVTRQAQEAKPEKKHDPNGACRGAALSYTPARLCNACLCCGEEVSR